MIARRPEPRMRTAMHHSMTTVASALLVAATMPGKAAWLRVGGYVVYWIGCAVAFVPVLHATDRLARAVNRRFGHVADDETLHDELRRYRAELDSALLESRADGGGDQPANDGDDARPSGNLLGDDHL